MFRTVRLSINRSFLLYSQQWYMSYRFADSLLASCQQTRHDLYDIFYYKNKNRYETYIGFGLVSFV
jgi:hypothetical protein